jgi:tRNA threonylcarbamoyladenosine biosynthesis protein TsaE
MATGIIHTSSAQETVDLGRRIASHLRAGDVVALVGNLGAGKTQLTRGLAAGLGADPRQVASPTFVLMSEYEAPVPVVHIDAYRIQSLADLESIGFTPELLEKSVTVVEWADRIAGELPADHLRIELIHTAGGREISVTPIGGLAIRMRDATFQISNLRPSQPCRTCGKPVAADQPFFPFCSDRCRLVDLNRWFKGSYSLGRPLEEDDDDLAAR